MKIHSIHNNLCQSCNTHQPISSCYMCFTCCIVEGGNCVRCFHDGNTIQALENKMV